MFKSKIFFNNNNKGMALVVSLGVIMVVSILAYGMLTYVLQESWQSGNFVDSTVAIGLAEAGVEQALYMLKSNMNNKDHPYYKKLTESNDFTISIDTDLLKAALVPAGHRGSVDTTLRFQLEETLLTGARKGIITILSTGNFNNVVKRIKYSQGIHMNSPGIIAPNHSFFTKYKFKDGDIAIKRGFFNLHYWEFELVGGKFYAEHGVDIPLSDEIVRHPSLGLDRPDWRSLWGLLPGDGKPDGYGWDSEGGLNLTNVNVIEFANPDVENNPSLGIFRSYLLDTSWGESNDEEFIGHTKNPPEAAYYNDKVINIRHKYADTDIGLYPADSYKEEANLVVDKYKTANSKYFKDKDFPGWLLNFGSKRVPEKVLDLNGWGSYKNVPNALKFMFTHGRLPNSSDDKSRPIHLPGKPTEPLEGLTYVNGSVFIEGWVKGVNTIVCTGNIYIGGDIKNYDEDSNLTLIALKSQNTAKADETGQVIYMPHRYENWSSLGSLFENKTPVVNASIYADNGFIVDKKGWWQDRTLFIQVKGNIITDNLNIDKMTDSLKIVHAKDRFDKILASDSGVKQIISLTKEQYKWNWQQVPRI